MSTRMRSSCSVAIALESVGQRLWEIEAARDTPELRAALQQTRDQRAARFSDMSFKTKGGRAIQTEIIGSVHHEGDRRAIQLNVRDLTERKKFERDLQETQKLESPGRSPGESHTTSRICSLGSWPTPAYPASNRASRPQSSEPEIPAPWWFEPVIGN